MSHYSQRADAGTGDWLMGAVKRNPEGLLLLAAGCALLLRSKGGSRASDRTGRQDEFRGPGRSRQVGSSMDNGEKGWSESVAQAARSAGDYASDVTERVTETASSYASSASEYVDDAARAARSTFQSTAKHVLEEQPLAVVLVGLAAGAAVAATFPATQLEKRALGPTGERLKDAAGRAGEQLKEASAKAGERLMSAAEERGLTSEGLKEVARDVGDAFSGALSSEQSSPTRQGASQKVEGPRGTSSPGRSQVRNDPAPSGPTSSGQSNPSGKRGPR